jgi:maltose alpha-D-glucosyltransferase/alpha-amylase
MSSNTTESAPPSPDAAALFHWPAVLAPEHRHRLASLLLAYAVPRRWYRAKASEALRARVVDLLRLDENNALALLEIEYEPPTAMALYALPLAPVEAAEAARLAAEIPHAIVTPLVDGGALIDGLSVPGHAAEALLEALAGGRSIPGEHGALLGEPSPILAELIRPRTGATASRTWHAEIPHAEQTNSTAFFGRTVLLKIYRQLTAGPNPERELGQLLTALDQGVPTPRILGAVSYRASHDGAVFPVGIAHEFVENHGDAWSFAAEDLRELLDRPQRPAGGLDTPQEAVAKLPALAGTLGRRTAELHLALARAARDGAPELAPELLTAADRAAATARARGMLDEHLTALGRALERLPAHAQDLAARLLAPGARAAITERLDAFRDCAADVVKTRTHGDLHLGQVLRRGDDFVIIDFEGEPSRPLAERRQKTSPLRDVMGMVRSFDYAAAAALRDPARPPPADPDERDRRESRASLWKKQVTDAFLGAYLAATAGASFMPRAKDEQAVFLTFYGLEKAIYEVGYELHNRPDWIEIPLRGLADLTTSIGGSGDRAP